MRAMRDLTLLIGLTLGWTGMAAADSFLAKQTCPATTSIHNAKPDGFQVDPGTSYLAYNLNKPNGEYVLVRIPGAHPPQRWVSLGCGELRSGNPPEPPPVDTAPQPAPVPPGGNPPQPTPVPSSGGASQSKPGEFLLAASWQPAFCEGKPDKTECKTATPNRFDGSHFTLHGLWPQPRTNIYCMVPPPDRSSDENHAWDALPEPPLTTGTRAGLDRVMPGTASKLQRHEWIKHGTCFGTGPEGYFRTALALMEQLNSSRLQALMAANIGKSVDTAAMRAAFEDSFGPGSAAALDIECGKDGSRTLIDGVSITLKGTLGEATRLRDVLDTSGRPGTGCKRAVVDPVGPN